jgi:hypothetical protein
MSGTDPYFSSPGRYEPGFNGTNWQVGGWFGDILVTSTADVTSTDCTAEPLHYFLQSSSRVETQRFTTNSTGAEATNLVGSLTFPEQTQPGGPTVTGASTVSWNWTRAPQVTPSPTPTALPTPPACAGVAAARIADAARQRDGCPIAILTFYPSSLTFDPRQVGYGGSEARQIVLSNVGGADAYLEAIFPNGDNLRDFQTQDAFPPFCGGRLSPGQTCRTTVYFVPEARSANPPAPDVRRAVIQFRKTAVGFTYEVPVSGTALAASRVKIEPPSLRFAYASAGVLPPPRSGCR